MILKNFLALILALPLMMPLMAQDDEDNAEPVTPYLGVTLNAMVISEVLEDSGAKAMGLLGGDEILAWHSKAPAGQEPGGEGAQWIPLPEIEFLKAMLDSHAIGDLIALKIKRQGREMVLKGKLKARPGLQPLPVARPPKGIVGQRAKDWQVSDWFQANTEIPPKLSDYAGKILVIFCFQHWCPGCHSFGLPLMARAEARLSGDADVSFLYLQTVYEGERANTFENGIEDIQKYSLKGPFGQTVSKNGQSIFMREYNTEGTPWIIIVDPSGVVRFNDFRFSGNDLDDAVENLAVYLKSLQAPTETSAMEVPGE